jgi:putative ATPase
VYNVDEDTRDYLAKAAGGDVRRALNAIDLLSAATSSVKGEKTIGLDSAQQVTARSSGRYDKSDDVHYDLMSGLQKSIRGSDPNAALHYLARLLESGDLLSPIRRMLVTACEDIGLAYPMAIVVTKACCDAAMQLGLPEAVMPLSEAVVLLATAPKSNTANVAYSKAASDIARGAFGDVPDHLKSTGYAGAEKLGRGQTYIYPQDQPYRYVFQQYLPDAIKDRVYYEYGENKNEQAAKAYWQDIQKKVREKE